MKTFIKALVARFCLWMLAKVGYQTDIILPPEIHAIADEITALIQAEQNLIHGSTDILGDSWLKFRRVATKIKQAHPDLGKADIFKAVIMIHEAISRNVSA